MITKIFNILGGLAIFIYGMSIMSDGLKHAAGERMRSLLALFSANRLMAVASGAVATCIIQSSSASTVMVIGFVNAGLLTLVQAMGIIFGANIGTTITAQLVAFKISWLIMPVLFLGGIFYLFKRKNLACWGETLFGFGLLFLGMEMMGGELKALGKLPQFEQAMAAFQCIPEGGIMPLGATFGAVAVGMVVTFIVQSSSASTGIIIAMGASGLLDLYTATALTLGVNIGTTVTAQLAALSANRVAKQAALAHTLFNVLGVLMVIVSFYIPIGDEPIFFSIIERFSAGSSLSRQIANAHTLFNVGTTIVLLPFVPLLARLCERLVPHHVGDMKYKRLEPILLQNPAIALQQTTKALKDMLGKAFVMADSAFRILSHNNDENQKIIRQLEERENDVDERQRDIADYLARLMECSLVPAQALQVPALLHCANDAERIGDHAMLILAIMERMKQSGVRFSPTASAEFVELLGDLERLHEKVEDLLADSKRHDIQATREFRRSLRDRIHKSEQDHIDRLTNGECRPEAGLIFLELLGEMDKISRHLSNIIDRADKIHSGAFADDSVHTTLSIE